MEHIGSLAKPDAPALRMVADMLAPTSSLGNFLRTAAQMAEDEGVAHFFANPTASQRPNEGK